MKINLTENKYNFDIEDLMVVANRANNPKRNFLFVSKLLGKHIEVNPNICKVAGRLLVSTLYKDGINTNILVESIKNKKVDNEILVSELNTPVNVEEKVYVLGFAETATGLGMAVASTIKDCHYQTTTRENIIGIKNMLSFEEEHSHATSHKCFTLYEDAIKNADRIILVDDEITTGNSMQNLIRELTKLTSVKKYTILSILDWRSQSHINNLDNLKKELGLEIDVLSIMSGNVETSDNTVYYDDEPESIDDTTFVSVLDMMDRFDVNTEQGCKDYYKFSGRFGVNYSDIAKLEDKCKEIAETINAICNDEDDILVLGHGEDIYIPSRVASYLKGNVKFKTTTRSPIYCSNSDNYPVKSKHSFIDEDVKYYLYNKEDMEQKYKKVIVLTENNLNVKLTDNTVIFKL